MFYSVNEFIEKAKSSNKKISEIMLMDQEKDMEVPAKKIYDKMSSYLQIMKNSIKDGLKNDYKSITGIAGGKSYKIMQNINSGGSLSSGVFSKAIMYAMAVSEHNACMGRIIAAPTAGSCGILPATLIAVMEEKNISEHDCVMAMFTASAFGMVISTNATVAGAEGGCQAECGSASGMAAAAIVEMLGGTPDMCESACAIALKCILGLVCDPIAGLVEVPCIKRNSSGATNALTAAEIALAGVESVVPADEVILTMKNIGELMSPTLRETSQGGLAVTPTGKRIKKQFKGIQG